MIYLIKVAPHNINYNRLEVGERIKKMDDVFNEMWDQFVKEGFDQPESMKESCYCIAKRYHELMGGVASPVHNQVSQPGGVGSKGGTLFAGRSFAPIYNVLNSIIYQAEKKETASKMLDRVELETELELISEYAQDAIAALDKIIGGGK